jgi:methylated-DNA-[protein]-cysteine S-methyltransferase
MAAASYDLIPLPTGATLAIAVDGQLVVLHLLREPLNEVAEPARCGFPGAVRAPDSPPLPALRRQLAEYFAGRRAVFELPLAPRGTEFERAVWRALIEIPYGETRSYAEIARRIGRPQACRAVGRANGRNPLGIVVPCHRVIGSDGSLTGYGGGLEMKQYLLDLEGNAARQRPEQVSLPGF